MSNFNIFDNIGPLTDIITKVLWPFIKDDSKPQPEEEEIKDDHASQIPEAYENVKYFEKQRTQHLHNESANGEKFSFKGRLGGSAKCDDSVINAQIEAPLMRNKDMDLND